MKTVIQRVSRASVTIGGEVKSAIGKGYMILLGVADGDTEEDVDWLVKKTAALRIFDDADGVMNITMTNLDLEHAYPIETTILGKKVDSIEAQIVTQEMHAKNTFEDPENVTVRPFGDVEKVHAGIRFTIPACSVLHIALK